MQGQRRQHFRIFFNPGEGPLFKCEYGVFPVLDVSQSGVRFSVPKVLEVYFFESNRLEGTLVFPEEQGMIAIAGCVVRTNRREIALQLYQTSHIPLEQMLGINQEKRA